MIRNCKRCHRTLKVHNVLYCDICQNNINDTMKNNVYKHNRDTLNSEEKKRQQVKI